jgi:atypical dual specificity phosphatase
MLVARDVSVIRGSTAILRRVSLEIPARSVLFVVGAGGAGKSSLLRALAPHACSSALPRFTGEVTINGYPLSTDGVRIVEVAQNARLTGSEPLSARLADVHGIAPADADHWLDEIGAAQASDWLADSVDTLPAQWRRALHVLAALQQRADLYLLDEPTAGLGETATAIVRTQIAAAARRACVVVATHNRLDCLAAGGHTALLAGGTLQECTDTAQFFAEPTTAAGRRYVESGSCNLPSEAAAEGRRDGIWWLVPGLLCGMSRPGISIDAATQFATLRDGGVHVLVCTEERRLYAIDALRDCGIELHHFPVPDMAPPTFAQAVDICRLAEHAIQANRGVAVHCRGGLGRTGTLLAAILIWLGDAAEEAIASVRARKPYAIQTPAQTRFLHDFASRLRDWRPQRPNPPIEGVTDVTR